MAKASAIQTSFNSGEFSPLMYGRVDLDRYGNGLKLCRNFIPLQQGPVARRPGTQFIGPVIADSVQGRLFQFQFSATQAYVLEFGESLMRVYKDRGYVLTGTQKTITGITKANPAVVTSAAHGFSNGHKIAINSVAGMTEVNGRVFTIANVAANTLELSGVNSSAYTTYTSGGTADRVFEMASPYTAAQLADVQITQSGDVLYFFHPSLLPRKLTRTAHDVWTFTTADFKDGPYGASIAAGSVTVSVASGAGRTITLDATATLTVNGGLGFVSTDVGRHCRAKSATGSWAWLKIVGYTSSTVCTADFQDSSSTATTTWTFFRMGLFGATDGYPECGEFYQDRLIMGGPTRWVCGSKTSSYENFAPSALDGVVADDNGFAFNLNTSKVAAIRWLLSDEKGVMCGTDSAEWTVRPATTSTALSPTNVRAAAVTPYGSKKVSVARTPRAALFVQRGGKILREMAYVFEVDGFRAPNMTLMSEHITGDGITDMAYCERPQALLWCVRTDGQLALFTYERENSITAWSLHDIGGGTVESVCTVPAPDGIDDDLYMIVKRVIGGTTYRHIEIMKPLLFASDDPEDAWFLDGALNYSGSAVTTLTGLWHLNGATVDVLADGEHLASQTVTNGRLTLARAASKVIVGFPFTSELQTLNINAGSADGTAQGKTKRIHKVALRLYKSLGGEYAASSGATVFDPILFREPGDDWGDITPLFTGDKILDWPPGYDTAGSVYIRQAKPFPLSIQAIMPQVVTQDSM